MIMEGVESTKSFGKEKVSQSPDTTGREHAESRGVAVEVNNTISGLEPGLYIGQLRLVGVLLEELSLAGLHARRASDNVRRLCARVWCSMIGQVLFLGVLSFEDD